MLDPSARVVTHRAQFIEGEMGVPRRMHELGAKHWWGVRWCVRFSCLRSRPRALTDRRFRNSVDSAVNVLELILSVC